MKINLCKMVEDRIRKIVKDAVEQALSDIDVEEMLENIANNLSPDDLFCVTELKECVADSGQ